MKHFIYFFLFATILYACTSSDKKGESITIRMDLENIKEIDFSILVDRQKIELELADNSFLADIHSIFFINNKLFVYGRGKVLAFDENGKFLFQVGDKGRGPGEYLNISSCFVNDSYINIYDDNNRKILKYNENGNFVKENKIDVKETYPSVHKIFPLSKKEGYIAKNGYMGGDGAEKYPTYSYYNKEFKWVNDVKDHFRDNSMTYPTFSFCYQEEILTWEFFIDVIYSIKGNTIFPKYIIDFGRYSLPDEIKRDIHDNDKLMNVVMWTNRPENKDRIASIVQYVFENDQYLYFTFLFRGGPCIARYDKKGEIADVFRVINTKGDIEAGAFLMPFNDKVVTFCFDESKDKGNPTILFLDI